MCAHPANLPARGKQRTFARVNKVLVYSPDAQRLAALQRVLTEAGLPVQGAVQSAAVFQAAAQGGVGLVVADVPSGDPAQALLAALHAQPSMVPVLLLVQRVEDATLGQWFQVGVADVLEQPLSQLALRDRAIQLLQQPAPPVTTPGQFNALAWRRLTDFVSRAHRSGLLTVDTVQGRAHIMVNQGNVAFAQFGSLTNQEAVQQILALPETHAFFFQPVSNDASTPTQPVAAPAVPAPDNPWQVYDVIPGTPRPPVTPPPQKVLVVDDDQALLEIACRFLQRGGFEVERATNGQEAMDVAHTFRPHVVVSDIMMPEVDGWALLRLVRDDYHLQEVPVIMLSCHDEYRDKLRQVGAGADAYLAKGIKGEQLMRTVQEVAARHRQVWTEMGPGLRLEGALDHVGGINLVRAIAWHKLTGTLHAQDQWVHAVLGIQDGELVAAGATADLLTLTGLDAVGAYVKMKKARFVFDPLQLPPQGPGADAVAAMDEACNRANRADEEIRERLMIQGGGLVIQPELMALYERVTEGVSPSVLAALSRGLSPGEVMAETGESPLLVEWVVKDMVRKGVAVFRDAGAAA